MGVMEEYDVIKLLGKGSFGSVYCVKRTSDRSLHVMKKISIHNMPPKERASTEQECKVLQRLRHPGVVCYEDSFIHKNRQLCIVMAFCEGGDLSSLIEKRKMRYFPESDVLSWFLQISLALQYMHDEHILHRDLKTQNIFLTKDNMIKLGDFGIAKVLEGTLEMAKTVIGTPYYMSPELFRNQPYSYKSDIWSLGCVLYELLSLRHAFDAREMKGLVQKILRGQYSPVPPSVSKDSRELVKAMLGLSPKSRPSVNEILTMPFIRKEMSAYIKSQLGDESAANFLQDDPRALSYHQIEQARLEKQARKLGFDVQRRADGFAPEPVLLQPAKIERMELKEPPKQSSLPSAADAERIRMEERERDRHERAKEFLERELRAKERAEEALRRLQREKQDRMKALMEQREMRAKRMAHIHPKGEAGNMNEWQNKLAKAHAQHEERRKAQGIVAPVVNDANRPKPTPRGQSGASSNDKGERKLSVLEMRNKEARERERVVIRNNSEEDKENMRQILVHPGHNQQQDEAAIRLKAMENNKDKENAKIRDEMNRDMQQMEVKLLELKKKKEEEDQRKKMKAAEDRRQRELLVEENRRKEEERRRKEREDQQTRQDREAAAALYRVHPAPPAVAAAVSPPVAAVHRPASLADYLVPPAPAPLYADQHAPQERPPLGHALPAPQYPSTQHPTAGRFVEKPQNIAVMAAGQVPMNPRPPEFRMPVRYGADSAQGIRAVHEGEAIGFSKLAKAPAMGKPAGLMMVDDGHVRHSFPIPQQQHAAVPVHNRLQIVPQAEVWTGTDDLLRDDGFNADLILRQKQLDRQSARLMVQVDSDRELKQFEMTVHRINRAVVQSANHRPMLLPGEVGAKISERDRQLRLKQQRAQVAQQRPGAFEPSVRIFGDVAYEGGLYSPNKKRGLYYEDEVQDEDDMRMGMVREENAEEVQDEELLYYDREVAKFEHEVAQRTLKIQMLRTAVMPPIVADDDDD